MLAIGWRACAVLTQTKTIPLPASTLPYPFSQETASLTHSIPQETVSGCRVLCPDVECVPKRPLGSYTNFS